MRKFIIIVFALAINTLIIAQKKLPDFGEIELADLKLQSCSFEPQASAMKLFDVQEIEFDIFSTSLRIKTERRVRIKIFSEKGYQHATIRIPYFSKRGIAKIKQLRAVIYNLDASGKIVTQVLERKDFFKDKAIENIKVVNFTFPNLKPGSVIEFSYTRIENNILQITPWIIQGEIPALYASNMIQTPAQSRIEKKLWGLNTIEERTDLVRAEAFRKTLLFKENIPSFHAETYMSSYKDNLMRVAFLLFPRGNIRNFHAGAIWSMAGTYLLTTSDFGGQIQKNIPGTIEIIDSAKTISSIPERISFIYDKVKKRIPNTEEQTFYPGDLIEVWKTQSGNTAEINLILLNLLQKSDIISYPLLVSTRDNGKVNMDFPSIGQFNGVDVLAVDTNKVYILDASLKFQSSHSPPSNILYRDALLLKHDEIRWIEVDDSRPLLKEVIHVQASPNESGMIEGTSYSTHYDYAKSIMLDTTMREEEGDKSLNKKPVGLKILSVTRENEYHDTKPLQQKTVFNYEPQQTGDFYFINPQVFSSNRENPFKIEGRTSDIDFGCMQEFTLNLNLSLHKTFEVDFIPKSIIVRAPDSSFIFRRTVYSDTEGISFQQSFEIKKPIFSREEYPRIQEFFKRVYALMSEEIVLKKKK